MPLLQHKTISLSFNNENTSMKKNYSNLAFFFLFFCVQINFAQNISIVEITYLDRPHFKITTPSVIYYFDRAGGGFSSMIDKQGLDWIAYKKDSAVATYPKSAAGQYRGIPNAVFGNEDGGVGHPGFDKAVSERTADNVISTNSKSGKWAWTYTFYKDYVVWNVTKTDPDYAYWLLYEGTIAGSWNNLADKYWGSDKKRMGEVNDFYKNQSISDLHKWTFFGDKKVKRVLYVAQKNADDIYDMAGFLGDKVEGMNASSDGMIVAGLGRDKKGKPAMKNSNTFIIGFYEKAVLTEREYAKFNKKMAKMGY
jgi:hypothetical protein